MPDSGAAIRFVPTLYRIYPKVAWLGELDDKIRAANLPFV